MWKIIKEDTMSKSTLYILDAEDQLSSIKLTDNDDPKTHLVELKTHFQMMLQCRDNLMKIVSAMTESRFNIVIMSSLPELYRPTLQTITTLKQASKLSGMQSRAMKADGLITFIIKEAQHCVINDDHMMSVESAPGQRIMKRIKARRKLHARTVEDLVMENQTVTRKGRQRRSSSMAAENRKRKRNQYNCCRRGR
jgi:hypothetical protein